MLSLFKAKTLFILVTILVIGGVVLMVFKTINPSTPNWITAEVERGDITEIVSVSGYIEAKNTAELSFPTTGVVTDVFVQEGDEVLKGQVLATQASAQLAAQRNEASAILKGANAQYDQLQTGPSAQERSVTQQNLNNAEQNLMRVKALEKEKVQNARNTLFSSSLTALSTDGNESAIAPTITGTYTCETEGSYSLNVYSSNAYSRYSYQLSGLETKTETAYTQQPGPLGTCGLYIQFDEDSFYANSKWIIAIPNKNSNVYVANKNAYELALKTQQANIQVAEDALALAQEQALEANASPRSEAITQSEASIQQALAKIATVDAQIADRSVVAPFDGIITDVSILSGETATTQPVITLLARDAFELKARVPEIDITKISVGQKTSVSFDALSSFMAQGEITYISPLATEIDGVAYFETTIVLSEQPDWIRSGLNADIDIIVGKSEDVLRVPKRFLTRNADGTYTANLAQGQLTTTRTVEVRYTGNDGFVEIIGLNEGDTIVAP